MGLGKTVQAITFLAGLAEGRITPSLRDGTLPHLIVVPPSLLFNWESEIARFYPALRVVTYAGQKRIPDFAGCRYRPDQLRHPPAGRRTSWPRFRST